MAAAFLLAAWQGVDLSKNGQSASVAYLVAQGYLTESLQPTERGQVFAHMLEGVAKDFDRSVARVS